jgi:hypothetical protein
MAKIYAQGVETVLAYTGAVAKWESISGSVVCPGYARLVGMFYANASASPGAASGLVIHQSADYGATWDILSASQSVSPSAASVFNLPIYGNAVRVAFYSGNTTAASLTRAFFSVFPV